MTDNTMLVVGSVAFDTIRNPFGIYERVLGGAATYACLAASYHAPTQLVAVVGRDFDDASVNLLRRHRVDLQGLEVAEGRTFFWDGEYSDDLNRRQTLAVELNVFEHFRPKLPESYRDSRHVLLANIDPSLQLEVLEQVRDPQLVVTDTMNIWIENKRDVLLQVLARTDILILNEEEGRQLTGAYPIMQVARQLRALGPRIVVVKQGEYGALLYTDDTMFMVPAYPLEQIKDPTGAGDSFAGAFLAHLVTQDAQDIATLKHAVLYGSALASFCVEEVSVQRLTELDAHAIETRINRLVQLATI